MADIPNLAGVATADLVEQIGGGNFKASYINWSRTMHLLRVHAPGWLPELAKAGDGGILHEAPTGAFLMIRFKHTDGSLTPEVPQAIMDTRNAAITLAKITARDITDTHRRGTCMAAAMIFGLAYELWAKMPLESGYEHAEAPHEEPQSMPSKIHPTDGAWEAMDEETQAWLMKLAAGVVSRIGDPADAHDFLQSQNLSTDEKAALWTQLESKTRTALKKAHEAATKAAKEKAA